MLGKQAWEELVLVEADVWLVERSLAVTPLYYVPFLPFSVTSLGLVGVSMCREGGFEEAGRKVWAR